MAIRKQHGSLSHLIYYLSLDEARRQIVRRRKPKEIHSRADKEPGRTRFNA